MGCGGSKPEDAPEIEPDGDAEPREEAEGLNLRKSAIDSGPLSADDLAKRLMGSEKAETFGLGISDFTLRYAALSQRGYYPEDLFKPNQDRYIIQTELDDRIDFAFIGVFDGHGAEGDQCSGYVRRRIVPELLKQMKRDRFKSDFLKAYVETFRVIDNDMHQQDDFDDTYSGTTAICAAFIGNTMYVANIGDSRAIIAERHGKRIVAFPLSLDQTPYRRDERERVKASGAAIMTFAMAEGIEPYVEGWENKQNDEESLDGTGDPPRLFSPGTTEPGCAFTRSIGDSSGTHLGIIAEAETLKKNLKEEDQAICIASDGVWEFLSNQSVCDTVFEFDDPVEAAKAVVSQAYSLWLQFEVRTDDITLIVAFVDHTSGKAPRPASEQEVKEAEAAMKMGRGAGTDKGDNRGSAVEVKPVRRGLSAEKKKNMGVALEVEEEDEGEWVMETHKKSKAEVERIQKALKGNFLFTHLPEALAKQIYDCMRKTTFVEGEVVIQQGDKGESFYVLDDGELKVTIEMDGLNVEILRYKPNPTGANPCFGELALMYSKPRAATVTAITDGTVWELDRRSFREILKKSSTKNLMRTLRSVDVLKSLSVHQLQRLSELLTEAKYEPGQHVIHQGEEGTTFYIIAEGRAIVTKNDASAPAATGKQVATLSSGQYFGERAILKSEVRAANVIADGDAAKGEKLHCLYISKESFEGVLGPLSKIIEDDATWRYKIAVVKQLRKIAAGLAGARVVDFEIRGRVCEVAPVQYVFCKHKGKFDAEGKLREEGREYTLKVRSKKRVVEMNMQSRLRHEMKLLTSMMGSKRLVPLPLQTFEDDSYIYSVMPTKVACTLSDLVEEMETLDESTCRFFAGVIAEAIQHVHAECAGLGGVLFRNMEPASITLNEDGWPQLLDFRFACHAEPPPRDFCGQVHYLSPEQVSGNGHGLATDFWAFGMLLYELLTSSNPWLTGDPTKDSELGIYGRVSGHKHGELRFPADLPLSVELAKFLNELCHPEVEKRLGNKKGKLASDSRTQIRKHRWFDGFQWDELQAGTLASPAKLFCQDRLKKVVASHLRQSQVVGLFDEVYVPDGGADFDVNETADLNFKGQGGAENTIARAMQRKQKDTEMERLREERVEAVQAARAKQAKQPPPTAPTPTSTASRGIFAPKLDGVPETAVVDPEAAARKAAMFGSLSANVHASSDTVAFTEKGAGEPTPPHQETLLEGLSRRVSATAEGLAEAVKKLTDRPDDAPSTTSAGFGGWSPPAKAASGKPGLVGFGGWVPPGKK